MTKQGWSQECKVYLTFERPKKKMLVIISLEEAFDKFQPSLLIKEKEKNS